MFSSSPLRGALVVLQLISSTFCSTFVPFSENHVHSKLQTQAATAGSITNISNVPTYVSQPQGNFDRTVAVLLLTDVFGLPKTDNLLLADSFAKNGFATYAPDYLNGDPLPEGGNVNISTWITRHGRDQTIPPMNAVIAQLRSTGVTKLFATGYCFGGLYVTLLAQNNSVEAVSMSHPSALQIPEDFEKVLNTSRVPIQINNAERDNALTPALASQVDGVLGDGRYRPGYSRQQFAGVGHGFAVTAQANDTVQVAARDGALMNAVNFFKTAVTNPAGGNSGAIANRPSIHLEVVLAMGAVAFGVSTMLSI